MSALDELVREGKVLYVGAGGRQMHSWNYADYWWVAEHRGYSKPVSAQVEWSLIERKNEKTIVAACERFGIGVIPFFPLAAGLLTGKYTRGAEVPADSRMSLPGYRSLLTDENFDRVSALTQIADAGGTVLLDLALGWWHRDHRSQA